jgi:hypothetical protein
VIVVEKTAFELECISSAKNIWIVISKKVELIISPIKVDAVLRFWNQVGGFTCFINTCCQPESKSSIESPVFSFLGFKIDDT